MILDAEFFNKITILWFLEITDNLLAAQLLIFFVGGFETSSTTMSHTLYELAINQHCQDRLRQEIRESLEKHNGKITYDTIKEMEYLDKVYHGKLIKILQLSS